MRTSLEVGTTVAALLLGAHVALAQHEGHGAPTAPAPRGTVGAARDVASVATLLKRSNESLRQMERAVEQSDPRLLGAALQEFVGVMNALEAHFDSAGGDPKRMRKDASKAQRALERHAARLRELSDVPVEFREALSEALHACDRARGASAAAYEEAAGALASAGDHHGAGRRRGCGHH